MKLYIQKNENYIYMCIWLGLYYVCVICLFTTNTHTQLDKIDNIVTKGYHVFVMLKFTKCYLYVVLSRRQ